MWRTSIKKIIYRINIPKINDAIFLSRRFAVIIPSVHYLTITGILMKISTRFMQFSTPVLFSVLAIASADAAAASFRNLPLSIAVETAEILTPSNVPGGVRCPLDQFYYGGITSSIKPGNMTIKLADGNYSRLVTAVATDCATTTFTFSQGKMTIFAVNGAGTISASYSGSFVPSEPGSTILNINSATFTITGGTGIFDGAVGSGELRGTVNATNPLLPMPGNLAATGTVSFTKPAFERGYTSY